MIALDALWPPSSGAYRDKVQGELEPMLALWPDVILLPTTSRLTPLELIDLLVETQTRQWDTLSPGRSSNSERAD